MWNGRKDVHAFGAAVVKIPSMKREVKRFAVFQKDVSNQHKTQLEFYTGAEQKEPSEKFELGVDFVLKVDDKSTTFDIKKKDGKVCQMTFYKAPCTKDVQKTMKTFVEAMQFLGDKKDAKLKALDTSVTSDDATLQEQSKSGPVTSGKSGDKSAAKSGGAAAASGGGGGGGGSASPTGGGTKVSGPKDDPDSGLFETVSESGGTKTLHYRNNMFDTQFTVVYTFKNASGIEVLRKDKTEKVSDGKYKFNIYPGESGNYAKGKWNGQSKGIRSDAPDKAWVDSKWKDSKSEIDARIKAIKSAMQKAGAKKASSESIAEACEKSGIPYVDLVFPPGKESLFRSSEASGMKDSMWLHPDAYLAARDMTPSLFVGDVEPNDIDQGSLGDCYLLSALACLSEFVPLVHSIFDEGQNYELGIYRASLCKNGWWHTITMDGYLPSTTACGPCFAKNREEPNELWVSLIEKAYAKLHGSYASIRAGSGGMALADLTGCPYELFNETKMKPDLFKQLEENDRNDYIQMLGTPGKDTSDYAGGAGNKGEADMTKKYEAVGLACGHAYSLITVTEYKGNQLCMIRNPWGNDKEWNGDWSDKSSKWSADAKKAVGWYDGEDGTFWMCWKDVCKWFTSASVCYVNGAWDQLRVAASFDNGHSDIAIKLEAQADCAAWMGVHQKDTRGTGKNADSKYIAVQLCVAKLEADGKTTPCNDYPNYRPARDVNIEFQFKKGTTYFVYAQTSVEDANKSFVMSMHSEVSEFAKITFLAPKQRKTYSASSPFTPPNFEQTEAIYQIKGVFSTNGTTVERQGAFVDFANAKRVLTDKEKKLTKNPASKGKSTLEQYASFPLEVTAICGKGLPALDDCGKSDPFLELRLRSLVDGVVQNSHTKPQTQFSTCIEKTLAPRWNTKHQFSCSGDDVLQIVCYDRDTKGKDFMGEFNVFLHEMSLEPGATVKKSFKLTGEIDIAPHKKGPTKGDIELSFTLMK